LTELPKLMKMIPNFLILIMKFSLSLKHYWIKFWNQAEWNSIKKVKCKQSKNKKINTKKEDIHN